VLPLWPVRRPVTAGRHWRMQIRAGKGRGGPGERGWGPTSLIRSQKEISAESAAHAAGLSSTSLCCSTEWLCGGHGAAGIAGVVQRRCRCCAPLLPALLQLQRAPLPSAPTKPLQLPPPSKPKPSPPFTLTSLGRSCSKCLVLKAALPRSLAMAPTRAQTSRTRRASAGVCPASPSCRPSGHGHGAARRAEFSCTQIEAPHTAPPPPPHHGPRERCLPPVNSTGRGSVASPLSTARAVGATGHRVEHSP
jgi:hypothetical protein